MTASPSNYTESKWWTTVRKALPTRTKKNAKEVRKEKEGHVSIPWRGLHKVGIFSEGHSSKVIMRFQPEHIDQFRQKISSPKITYVSDVIIPALTSKEFQCLN